MTMLLSPTMLFSLKFFAPHCTSLPFSASARCASARVSLVSLFHIRTSFKCLVTLFLLKCEALTFRAKALCVALACQVCTGKWLNIICGSPFILGHSRGGGRRLRIPPFSGQIVTQLPCFQTPISLPGAGYMGPGSACVRLLSTCASSEVVWIPHTSGW